MNFSSIPGSAEVQNVSYDQLPEPGKKEIDMTYEMKNSLWKIVDELKRSDMNDIETFHQISKKIKTDSVVIETSQQNLLRLAHNLRSEVREISQDTRRFGVWGIQEIQRETTGPAQSEILPIGIYTAAVDKLEKRLASHRDQVEQLEQQLRVSVTAKDDYVLQSGTGAGGVYGHRTNKLQPQQIAQLIRHQNEAFLRVAAVVAASHERVDALRDAFRSHIVPAISGSSSSSSGGGGGSGGRHMYEDPFLAADKKEAAATERKLKEKSTTSMVVSSLVPTNPNMAGSALTTFPSQFPGNPTQVQVQPSVASSFFQQPTNVSSGLSIGGFGSSMAPSYGIGGGSSTLGGGMIPMPIPTTSLSSPSFTLSGSSSSTNSGLSGISGFGTGTMSFGGGLQGSAAGDLVTPTTLSGRLGGSGGTSDRTHNKKKAGYRSGGAGKH
eukprot:gene12487-26288_t